MNIYKMYGFSLVELLIAIVVLGVVAAIAIPSFNETMERRRLSGAAESISSVLQLARSEAIKQNTSIYFNFNATEWCIGISDVDADTDGNADACDCAADTCSVNGRSIRKRARNYKNISGSGGGDIIFDKVIGAPNTARTFTLTGSSGATKTVAINAAGLITIN